MPLMPIAKDRPDQRNDQTEQTHHHQGNNRHKAGAAEEGQGIRQADIVEALVQHPDNYPGDHRPEDPGINRLDTDHALNVVGLQHGGVGGRQNAFRGQPEVNRQVHHRVAHKTGKRRDAFVLARQAQRDSDTEHHGQELKAKEPTLLIQMNHD
jgi:hypothetical protein